MKQLQKWISSWTLVLHVCIWSDTRISHSIGHAYTHKWEVNAHTHSSGLPHTAAGEQLRLGDLLEGTKSSLNRVFDRWMFCLAFIRMAVFWVRKCIALYYHQLQVSTSLATSLTYHLIPGYSNDGSYFVLLMINVDISLLWLLFDCLIKSEPRLLNKQINCSKWFLYCWIAAKHITLH